MSIDGADLGVKADVAVKAVLGGPQPTEKEKMSVDEMREWLLSAKLPSEKDDYGEYARNIAGCFLRLIELCVEPEEETLWEKAKQHFPEGNFSEATGFQVGWAVNAARRCANLPPVPNPAIITVEVKNGV